MGEWWAAGLHMQHLALSPGIKVLVWRQGTAQHSVSWPKYSRSNCLFIWVVLLLYMSQGCMRHFLHALSPPLRSWRFAEVHEGRYMSLYWFACSVSLNTWLNYSYQVFSISVLSPVHTTTHHHQQAPAGSLPVSVSVCLPTSCPHHPFWETNTIKQKC